MPKYIPLKKWEKFWRLTATWWYETRKQKNWKFIWFCELECDCWTVVWRRVSDVKRWRVNSCWCLRKENTANMFTTHWCCKWFTHNKLYRTYQWLKDRCTNPKNEYYENYWWRWIKCLWKTFEEFKSDMEEWLKSYIKQFWERNTTIDRIDVNWDYCKKNCRRATYKQQANNTRRNRYEKRNWKTMSITDIYNSSNSPVSYTAFYSRYYKLKRPLEDCLYRLPGTKTREVLYNKNI